MVGSHTCVFFKSISETLLTLLFVYLLCLADRAYTLYDGLVFKNSHRLQLYITPDGVKDQVPNAPIFQINHLPLSMTNDGLYNQFRPFGPIRLCKIIVEKDSSFNGTALLQYFNQQDADCALMNMVSLSVQYDHL